MLGIVDPVPCTDKVVLDMWHPVGVVAEIPAGTVTTTLLLGHQIAIEPRNGQGPAVRLVKPARSRDGGPARNEALPVRTDFGYVWTSLGCPPDRLFDLPEVDEPGRLVHNAISICVNTSAPRAVENFLDLAHFMTVHAGYLGDEPHTEIVDYDVDDVDGEIVATDCFAYQPQAAAGSTTGAMVEYAYRVTHPYCAILYKKPPEVGGRADIYTVFLQAMTEEWTRLHMLDCVVDTGLTRTGVRDFVQAIVAQDKPVLENQVPKRLPLDPRAEVPIRADKSAVAYRRWLRNAGVTYGVIPYPGNTEQPAP